MLKKKSILSVLVIIFMVLIIARPAEVYSADIETYTQKGYALEPYEKPVMTYYTVVENKNKTVEKYSYEATASQKLRITDGYKKGSSMRSFLYVGKVNNNNQSNLALVSKFAEVKNPQSVVITPDGRYAYIMYVNKGSESTELKWKGYVIRYDLQGIRNNHKTEVRNGKAITLKKADFQYIKKGPTFVTGHGQSMAYNPVTKELWFIGAPKSIKTNLQRINTRTLKPDKKINFTLSETVKMGNNLAFDSEGNAYFYTRVANNNWPTAPKDSIKIYKGTIGEKSVSFKMFMQGIHYPPGPIGQSFAYNPANDRLYLVDDGAIMSVPVKKLGKLKPSDVRISILEHSSIRRESEGLAFTADGEGYYLTNKQPELMKVPANF